MRRSDKLTTRPVLALIVGVTLAVAPLPAFAQQRTPAEAASHALEEQANACAQRKAECWTPTPAPTATPRPTATPTPPPVAPAPAVEPVEDTPPPSPPVLCWALDEEGNIRFREEDGTPVSCDDWTAAQAALAEAAAANAVAEPPPSVIYVPVPQPVYQSQPAPPPRVVYVYPTAPPLPPPPSTPEPRVVYITPVPPPPTFTPTAAPTRGPPTATVAPTARPTGVPLAGPVEPELFVPEPEPEPAAAVDPEPSEPPYQPINLPFHAALAKSSEPPDLEAGWDGVDL